MNGAPWTPEHDATLRSLAGLFSDCEIGAITGHAAITVRKRRNTQGLPAYHPAARKVRYGSFDELSSVTKAAISASASKAEPDKAAGT